LQKKANNFESREAEGCNAERLEGETGPLRETEEGEWYEKKDSRKLKNAERKKKNVKRIRERAKQP